MWNCIEDHTPVPEKIWFSRERETDTWTPLRKIDCQALNACSSDVSTALIESGRATADLSKGVITYNFYNAPQRFLCSAIWFSVEKKGGGLKTVLTPIGNPSDSDTVENCYQQALEASSTFGEGMSSINKIKATLDEDESQVFVQKSGKMLSLARKTKGLFGTVNLLQRGYGVYVDEHEANELALGPVRHLMFVIHGVGESYMGREDTDSRSFREVIDETRKALHRKQIEDWQKLCESAKRDSQPKPSPPNRVELVPIEWYKMIHSSSSSIMRSLKAATLPTIPALRDFVSDFVLDVMIYLTPKFCEAVLENVTEQISESFQNFQKAFPNFVATGGKVSLCGHSLGSIIVWDLLSVLKDMQANERKDSDTTTTTSTNKPGVSIAVDGHADIGYQTYASEEDANQGRNGTWGPTVTKPIQKAIPFVPDNSILLGSPIGLFLTLRGAHAVFDEMRLNKEIVFLDFLSISPFKMPTGSLYNIFHANDPVAYRIEPLLLAQDTDSIDYPQPAYLTPHGQNVRFHLLVKELSNNMFKKLSGSQTKAESHGEIRFPLGGKSNRIDFQLQSDVVENEYLSAFTKAHAGYFDSSDLHNFFVDAMTPREETKEVVTPREETEEVGGK